MKFDDILDEIGDFGWYQKLLVFLLYLPAVFIAMVDMGYIFMSAIPNYRCHVNGCDNNMTTYEEDFLNFTTPYEHSKNRFSQCQLFTIGNASNYDSCPIGHTNGTSTYNCDKWKYDTSVYLSTVVTKFNIVCDNDNLATLAQSLYMAGSMLGGILVGMASDKFGRNKALFVSSLICMASGVASVFVPNYTLYLFLRFIIGGSITGVYCVVFIMSIEYVGKDYRGLTGMLINVPYSLGEIVFGGLAYAIRDWQYLQLTISAPFAFFLLYYWIIPESPRWMLLNGKVKKAHKALTKMAKSHGTTITMEMLVNLEPEDEESKSPEAENVSWLDFFRVPYLRLITINLCIVSFTVTMSYFGIAMSAPSLGGNQYLNFIIMGAVEIPADFLALLSINKIGRRYTLCFFLILGGIAGVCTAFVPETPEYFWLSITLATIGKFGTAASYGVLYIFSAELYPTQLRNSGVAIGVFIGSLGSVIAPYIAHLSTINVYIPLVIFGLCSLISGLTSLTLPETLGKLLPETVKDCEELVVYSCFSRCKKSHQGL